MPAALDGFKIFIFDSRKRKPIYIDSFVAKVVASLFPAHWHVKVLFL